MLTRCGVGVLPGRARPGEADVERAAAGAVEVARDPVAALAPAMGEIAPAHGLGPGAERGGDGGRVHGAARRQGMHGFGMKDSSGLAGEHPIPAGLASRRRRRTSGLREARARGPDRYGLESGSTRKGRRAKCRPGRRRRMRSTGRLKRSRQAVRLVSGQSIRQSAPRGRRREGAGGAPSTGVPAHSRRGSCRPSAWPPTRRRGSIPRRWRARRYRRARRRRRPGWPRASSAAPRRITFTRWAVQRGSMPGFGLRPMAAASRAVGAFAMRCWTSGAAPNFAAW